MSKTELDFAKELALNKELRLLALQSRDSAAQKLAGQMGVLGAQQQMSQAEMQARLAQAAQPAPWQTFLGAGTQLAGAAIAG